MSVERFKISVDGCVDEHSSGDLVYYDDHMIEVNKLQKEIDALTRFKPSDKHKYLIQWNVKGIASTLNNTKWYDELQPFLDELCANPAVYGITVCALNPVKVTEKTTLIVEL